jgi:hypothetical protein
MMNKASILIFILMCRTEAVPGACGQPEFSPFPLQQLVCVFESDDALRFTTNPDGQVELSLYNSSEGGLMAELIAAGRSIFPKSQISDAGCLEYTTSVYQADLNQDGKEDYIVSVEARGNGMNANYICVSFLLSDGDEFRLTELGSDGFTPGDILQYEGQVCFLRKTYIQDRWLFAVFMFKEASVVPDRRFTRVVLPAELNGSPIPYSLFY